MTSSLFYEYSPIVDYIALTEFDEYAKIAFKIGIENAPMYRSEDEKYSITMKLIDRDEKRIPVVTMKLRYSGEDLATIPVRDLLRLLFQLSILYYR